MADPLSIATGVLALFQGVYLTSRFVYRQVLVAKGFHAGKAEMAGDYRFQIVRLRTFWIVLTREIGPKTTANSLAGLHKACPEVLGQVHAVMLDIATGLNAYATVAREMDEEYARYSERAFVLTDASKALLELPLDLDDAAGPTKAERDAEKCAAEDAAENCAAEDAAAAAAAAAPNAKPEPQERGFWNIFGKKQDEKQADKQVDKQADKQADQTRSGVRWKEIPRAFAWCFEVRRLRKSLKVLTGKIDKLLLLGPYLVATLDHNSTVGQTIQTADSGRAFQSYRAHLMLQKKAADVKSGVKLTDVDESSWNIMQAYIADSRQTSTRILVERKVSSNFARSSMDPAAVRERSEEVKFAPQLASFLAVAGQEFLDGATLGILPFKGFAKDPAPNGCFTFAFGFPRGTLSRAPPSLHELIVSDRKAHRLGLPARFQIAKAVAQCLGTLHSDWWLHKRISSRVVRFFFRQSHGGGGESLDTAAPYLTDFAFARPTFGVFSAYESVDSVVHDIDRDVYRHPERVGAPPKAYYNPMHDVYSLGVVLLEIGLWRTARQLYDDDFKDAQGVTGIDVTKAFLKRARTELDHRMGPAYRDAVVLCLDGRKLGSHQGGKNLQFGIEFQKQVVQKVDVACLNAVATGDFVDDDAAPPSYEDVVPVRGKLPAGST
ncbi:hypothetical protein B0T26DRAFT_670890 [Lasiosphaeria miniovina]|uniref:Prion-inhibition and propagation HeLo domain-containing protein n=1 Tax=Lasiosphaeria miniovina TaxID=1954250 RepID=A0AA40BI54_9PEZI|nr:uncharacterized protein B0T26DRAFT_670890 [Lasiosphaeria miniovina]KAK0734620.1 hypothetical protein B0T26DRAFT_670890 [Lasiosphaeria miniovina]